jgi:hypothetical protein
MMNAMLLYLLRPIVEWIVGNVTPLTQLIIMLLWWNALIVCLLRAKMTAFAQLYHNLDAQV